MPARRLLPCVLGAALLTACGDTTDTTDTTELLIDAPSTTLTTPPTQALELGEFDPEGDFQVFDPCTEIPAEVLEAAGFERSEREPFVDPGRSITCYYRDTELSAYGFFGISGDRIAEELIEGQGLMLRIDVESNYPSMYWHSMGSSKPDECSAAIPTTRGRVVVDHVEASTVEDLAVLCGRATEKLETILQFLGENNGNVDRS